MRGKEDAHDYRYFPEPDLEVLQLSAERLARLRSALPEMPWKRRAAARRGSSDSPRRRPAT